MADTHDPDAGRSQENDDAMTQILRLAGARTEVAPERTARVRATVHAAWLANRRRVVRTKVVAGAAGLAAAAAIVLAIRLAPARSPAKSPTPETIARSELVIGTPRLERPGNRDVIGFAVTAGTPARRGDTIATDEASAAALNTSSGASVRVDAGSRVRLLSAASIELLQGRVYVATAKAASGFEVHTAFGTVRDRGTRFEVRLEQRVLHLRIREGLVELEHRDRTVVAPAGQETIISQSGIETKPLSTYGAEWAWTDRLRPPFEIEGRTLADFLERLAAEQGWSLRYAGSEIERAASAVTLHGSVDGLSAEQALGVAISTSGFRYRLRQGELFVFRSGDAR